MPLLLPITLLCTLVALLCAQDILRARRTPLLTPRATLPEDGELVSVLIPARDEAARIGACLDELARQSYQRFELIVVDETDRATTPTRLCAPMLNAFRG